MRFGQLFFRDLGVISTIENTRFKRIRLPLIRLLDTHFCRNSSRLTVSLDVSCKLGMGKSSWCFFIAI